mmetsp:Transcript_16937/g.21438  ORF Transcript_16937/g.21438 Transcript_16937/m.21438 type:complete len:307 (+) Transcript_16937:70-990(+)
MTSAKYHSEPKQHGLLETDLISNHFFNHDVVIPKHGGGREISHTIGFRRYTKLVNESIEEYKRQRSSNKRQFVIDKIITPLLNEGRRFYRYNRQKHCYDLVDLSDDNKVRSFTMNVVMQKIRDIVKQNDNYMVKRKMTSQPCPSKKADPKRAFKKTRNQFDEPVDPISSNVGTGIFSFNPIADDEVHEVLLSESFNAIEPDESENFEDMIDKIFENNERENVTSLLSPLLNILLSHPSVKYFTGATNEINLMVVQAKLENKLYNSVNAVEKDLYDIFSNQSDEVGRMSEDFLTLVKTFCRGINHLL